MKLKDVPMDKQAHFWWGWAVSATAFPLIGWGAVFCAAMVGIAKEFWDSKGHGTPDKYDFIATAIGGIVGTVACAVIGAVNG